MISTHELSIAYHGQTVLENVSLDIRAGEVLALVGPSGCGKSSYLMALNRLTDLIPGASVQGQILYRDRDLQDAFPDPSELRRCIGMIFQQPNPFAMSIRRNIELPLREHGERDRIKIKTIVESVLRDVGLWDEVRDRLDKPALELSGGQRQRLCIARALALQPAVLLMDEPCSALDPMATERIETLIQEMRQRITVIIVTHNLAQARRLADRTAVFWVRDNVGQMIECGDTKTLFESSKNETVRAYLSGAKG